MPETNDSKEVEHTIPSNKEGGSAANGASRKLNGDSSKTSGHSSKTNGDSSKTDGVVKTLLATAKEPEPSNAERKKQQKVEKAAKRAQAKGIAQGTIPDGENTAALTGDIPGPAPKDKGATEQQGSQTLKPKQAVADLSPQDSTAHTRRTNSTSTKEERTIPLRRRLSQSTTQDQPRVEKPKREKQVSFFAHLYNQPRRPTLEGASKDVHPAILALALQISSYTICGSHARCVAMLLALKSVISSYTTPHGTSLPRHLSSAFLSPHLTHLKLHGRPFSTSQSNTLRWLKNLIANIDPSTPEPVAKSTLLAATDTFIRERFTIADQVIAAAVADKWITDGDVVLVYGKSCVVQQALALAARNGKKFRVIVVDSRPLFEGRNLARALSNIGVEVSYCLTTGLAQAAKGATKCIVGAHAVLGNGGLYSRVGTAAVTMMARAYGAPVVVCAETIKFTERVALDSIVVNELAPEEELICHSDDDDGGDGDGGVLRRWREKENLHLLNIMYDVTPARFIGVVVTELGSVPAGSAPTVQRMSAGAEGGGL